MTNAQIVMNLKEELGIPELVPMLTYAEWKKHGYQVKRGEHGIKVNLWKHLDSKSKKGFKVVSSEDEEETEDGYIHKTCTLFLPNQVEAIKN